MKHVKTASGIRRKILYGFVVLGSLLFLSGLISFFELSKLTKATQSIMDISIQDVELSKKMLDAVQEQNTALLQKISKDTIGTDSVIIKGRETFEATFNQASLLHSGTSKLAEVAIAKDNYNAIVNQIFTDSKHSENLEWFTNIYKTSYYDLTLAIKSFMISTQNDIEKNTNKLRSNAYRAIMPGIIALGIAIIIIIIFFMLIDLYYIRPITKITRSLGNYLHNKIPFNVKVDGHDEIYNLNEYLAEIMTILKKKE